MRQPSRKSFALPALATLAISALAACEAPTPSPDFTPSRPSGTEGPTDQGGTGGSPGGEQPGPIGNGKPEDGPQAAVPRLVTIAPTAALVDGAIPTLIVTGTGFVPRSFVELEFVPLPTSFISDKELRATVPDGLLGTTGSQRITVSTAPPGGGTSGAVKFEVQNPMPKLTTLAPTNVLLNAEATTVSLSGSGFVAGSKLTFGGVDLAATVTSATTLTTTLPANRLTASGTMPMTVTNPGPGGGTSTQLAFTVANPNVTISTLSPVRAELGASGAALTVTGTGFVAASKISFNGTAMATTLVGSTRLTAAIPATSLVTTGNFPVVVTNPAPGGGVSVPATFQVANPAPVATAVAPARVVAGAGPTAITVTGSRFTSESDIRINGALQSTTFASATELRATVPAALLATARTLDLDVRTPAPGGGDSGRLSFVVENPAPTVTSTSPSSLGTGAANVTISVVGSRFVATSVAVISGTDAQTTYESSTSLRAVVPAARLAAPGSFTVAVRNPTPGGGASSPRTINVTATPVTAVCDTAGADVVLTQLGAVSTTPLDYKYGPSPRFLYSSTDAAATTCPVAALSTLTQSYAAIVVQNGMKDTLTLSTWAACTTSRDDAFMAVYERTSTVPTTDAARRACTKRVSNGSSSSGNFASPESAGSIGCPGLTKQNNGAILLLPCEKAVVLVQPFLYPTYERPTTLKLKLEE